MFALKSVSGVLPQSRALIAARNMSVVSGPPTTRISFAEKMAHGLVMTVGFLAIPSWVLVNINNYRGVKE